MDDNSEHETAMLDMVKDHCEVMYPADKIKIIDIIKDAMEEVGVVEAAIDVLAELIREARLDGYRLGRSTANK